MNRTVRTLLGLLTIGLVALTSCKKDNQEPKKNEGTTYVSVAIGLKADGMRAGDDENNYSQKGKWNGKDAIETVDVYVVSKGEVAFGQYTKADFTITAATDADNITITPKKGIVTTPGEKEVYVLLNATEAVRTLLKESLPNNFKAAYNKAIENMTTADVARSTTGTDKADLIMMTNAAECKINVEDGVSEADTRKATDPKNRAKVQVQRVVARVLLTTTEEKYEIKYDDGKVMGEITDITYSVAQGEKAFYLSQHKDDQGLILTPAYNFMPIAATDPSKLTNYTDQAKMYDYSDLNKKDRKAIVANSLSTALEIGKQSLTQSVFMFEANHLSGAAGQTYANYTGKFRRANTPYVLVRAKFTPKMFASDEEKAAYEATTNDGTFYLGEDGLIYADNKTTDNTTSPAKKIRPEQKYYKYEKGKVLYVAFVNPDDKGKGKTLNAHVFRNNIYHISVSGFKKLGMNWNPLYPEDPDTTDPKNPDPKPKDDPYVPPFTPNDLNSQKETFMAVDVTVIPWNVHSYDIELTV